MFETVFGHDRIKTIMQRVIEREGLHHGMCFHGPSGIGKRLLAQEVAKAMNCESRTGQDGCRHCVKFDHGNHPDYREIEPDGMDIKVDQIRDISENLHFRPFEARYRFVVLDQVDRMREEAANAFLKSLEEPPDYVFFILVTSDLKALLPTILSRCQKIGFQSLKEEDKTNILVTKFKLEPELAARLASISFRRLEIEEEVWSQFQDDVNLIIKFLGMMVDQGHAIDLMGQLIRDKAGFPRFLDHLTATLRELTLISRGLESGKPFEEWKSKLMALAQRCDPRFWDETWERVVRFHGLRRHHLNQGLWFNTLSVTGLGLLEHSEQEVKHRLAKSGSRPR